MRIQLEVGNKGIDLNNRLDVYETAAESELFLGLLRDALMALGYSEVDLLNAWKSKEANKESR